ncbi:MAG: L,D-transpeptidase family protein [Prosthecobacter sp.]
MKPNTFLSLSRASLIIGAVVLSACQSAKKQPPPPEPVKQEWKYPGEWTGGDKPITKIVVNVDTQRATLYNDDDVVGWTYVASGITSFPTPTGDFQILEKVKDKVSNLYGKGYDADGKLVNSDFKQGRDVLPQGGKFVAAPMKYFMRLTNDGVGMHIGAITRPGRRASHGCIRLPSKMAPILYAHTVIGTPVSIVGNGPDYNTYLAQSKAKAKANAAKYAAAKKKLEEAKTALAEAAALPPEDPNGPATAAGEASATAATTSTTAVVPTPVPTGAPAEEIKPAVPTNPPSSPSPSVGE